MLGEGRPVLRGEEAIGQHEPVGVVEVVGDRLAVELRVAVEVLAPVDRVEPVHASAVDRVQARPEAVHDQGVGHVGRGRQRHDRPVQRLALGGAVAGGVRAEVVVVGPVLLDHEDHVLDRHVGRQVRADRRRGRTARVRPVRIQREGLVDVPLGELGRVLLPWLEGARGARCRARRGCTRSRRARGSRRRRRRGPGASTHAAAGLNEGDARDEYRGAERWRQRPSLAASLVAMRSTSLRAVACLCAVAALGASAFTAGASPACVASVGTGASTPGDMLLAVAGAPRHAVAAGIHFDGGDGRPLDPAGRRRRLDAGADPDPRRSGHDPVPGRRPWRASGSGPSGPSGTTSRSPVGSRATVGTGRRRSIRAASRTSSSAWRRCPTAPLGGGQGPRRAHDYQPLDRAVRRLGVARRRVAGRRGLGRAQGRRRRHPTARCGRLDGPCTTAASPCR